MSSPLLPPERMALLLATEQIKRRENPSPNITAVLIMALARLVDKLADEETQLQAEDASLCLTHGHTQSTDPEYCSFGVDNEHHPCKFTEED